MDASSASLPIYAPKEERGLSLRTLMTTSARSAKTFSYPIQNAKELSRAFLKSILKKKKKLSNQINVSFTKSSLSVP